MHAIFLEWFCTFTSECIFGRAKKMDISSFLEREAHAGQAVLFLVHVT
jgi:hypothetical protein